ncbi:hypothetical protein EB796_002846 [Bugula neritina]|uniref:Uncharacterized protein n=1 Tax=Bugula neritina TaxID=10212 RepID=A0A7J7KLC0_BUGNE|nr:hypothetical protein EB796_002846 [Bugula neritina]
MHTLSITRSIPRHHLAHPSSFTKQVHTQSQLSKLQWEDPNLSVLMKTIQNNEPFDLKVQSRETALLWHVKEHLILDLTEELKIDGPGGN